MPTAFFPREGQSRTLQRRALVCSWRRSCARVRATRRYSSENYGAFLSPPWSCCSGALSLSLARNISCCIWGRGQAARRSRGPREVTTATTWRGVISNFLFALRSQRGISLDRRRTDTRLLNPFPTPTTTYFIPASFEQTQRVPTGHQDFCLCDVSGATNYRSTTILVLRYS